MAAKRVKQDDKRMGLLEKARQRAYEIIDDNSALSDKHFAELSELPEDEAIEKLAAEFLDEAAEYAKSEREISDADDLSLGEEEW